MPFLFVRDVRRRYTTTYLKMANVEQACLNRSFNATLALEACYYRVCVWEVGFWVVGAPTTQNPHDVPLQFVQARSGVLPLSRRTPPASAAPNKQTGGPARSWPPTPTYAWPEAWSTTTGCPGRNPANPTNSPPPASDEGFIELSHTCPPPPDHQNPTGPDQDAPKAPTPDPEPVIPPSKRPPDRLSQDPGATSSKVGFGGVGGGATSS